MGDPFEGIIGLLAEEVDLHRRLLALARDEQRALVRSHPAELAVLITRQEAVVAEIRRLEQARLEIRALLAERDGCHLEELTMPTLVRSAAPHMAARFESLRETLAGVLGEVADVNKANTLLIRDHITYLNAVVGIVTRTAVGVTSGAESSCECAPSPVREVLGDASTAGWTVR
jgi:flagellar biosynthesis/type III secretory pathway chaperone